MLGADYASFTLGAAAWVTGQSLQLTNRSTNATFDNTTIRVHSVAPDPAYLTWYPNVVKVEFQVMRFDGYTTPASVQIQNENLLQTGLDNIDAKMEDSGWAYERVRGPFPAPASSSACMCNTQAVALSLGAYGVRSPDRTVRPQDVRVRLDTFPAPQPYDVDLVVHAHISRQDCCAVDFRVEVMWHCIVGGQDILPDLLRDGKAQSLTGPALTLRAPQNMPNATLRLELRLLSSSGRSSDLPPGTAWHRDSFVTFTARQPVQFSLSPGAGISLLTLFALGTEDCGRQQRLDFFFETAGRRMELPPLRSCSLATQLPDGTTSVSVCRTDRVGEQSCATQRVTVFPRSVSVSELNARLAAMRGAFLKELATEAIILDPAVDSIDVLATREELKASLARLISDGLALENDQQRTATTVKLQPVDPFAVSNACRSRVLQHLTAMELPLTIPAGVGVGSRAAAASEASDALYTNASDVWLCEPNAVAASKGRRLLQISPSPAVVTTLTASQVPVAPTSTASQAPVGVTSTPSQASSSGPTELIMYIAEVREVDVAFFEQQLQSLLNTSTNPILANVQPKMRPVGTASGLLPAVRAARALAGNDTRAELVWHTVLLEFMPLVFPNAEFPLSDTIIEETFALAALITFTIINSTLDAMAADQPRLIATAPKLLGVVTARMVASSQSARRPYGLLAASDAPEASISHVALGAVHSDEFYVPPNPPHLREPGASRRVVLEWLSFDLNNIWGRWIPFGVAEVMLTLELRDVVEQEEYTSFLLFLVEYPLYISENGEDVVAHPYGPVEENITGVSPVLVIELFGAQEGQQDWDGIAPEGQTQQLLKFRAPVDIDNPALVNNTRDPKGEGRSVYQCEFFDRTGASDALPLDPSPPAGNWSQTGCTLVGTNGSQITCACTHLTEFRGIRKWLPTPRLITASDVGGILEFNSPIVFYGLLGPIWALTVAGCVFGRWRDKRRQAVFVSEYYFDMLHRATQTGKDLCDSSSSHGPLEDALGERSAVETNEAVAPIPWSWWRCCCCWVRWRARRKESLFEPTFHGQVRRASLGHLCRPSAEHDCYGPPETDTLQEIVDARRARRPALVLREPETRTSLVQWLRYLARKHTQAGVFHYPVTHHVRYAARVQIAQCMLMTNIVLLAVWYEAIGADSTPMQRLVQQLLIILFNEALTIPVRNVLLLPFYWVRPVWRIPRLLPCPEPPYLPWSVLSALFEPPPDPSSIMVWHPGSLRSMAVHASHPLLQEHLVAIADAMDMVTFALCSAVDWIEDIVRSAVAPDDGADTLSEVYHLVLVAGCKSQHAHAMKMLDVALATANPDFLPFLGSEDFLRGQHMFYQELMRAFMEYQAPDVAVAAVDDSVRVHLSTARAALPRDGLPPRNPLEPTGSNTPRGSRSGLATPFGPQGVQCHSRTGHRHAAADLPTGTPSRSPRDSLDISAQDPAGVPEADRGRGRRASSPSIPTPPRLEPEYGIPVCPEMGSWRSSADQWPPLRKPLRHPPTATPVRGILDPTASYGHRVTVVAVERHAAVAVHLSDAGPDLKLLMLLLELNLAPLFAEALGTRSLGGCSWTRGQECVRERDLKAAVRHFMQSEPPVSPVPSREPLDSRSLCFWLYITAVESDVALGFVYHQLRALGALPRQAPPAKSTFPYGGGGAPLMGHCARPLAMRVLQPKALPLRKPKEPPLWQTRAPEYSVQEPSWLINAAVTGEQVLFVDCAASPERQTGSRLHPYCQLEAALAHSRAGDTIILLPGRYGPLCIENIHCAYDHPVHIRGVGAQFVIVSARYSNQNLGKTGISIKNCRNICVSNMTVCSSKIGVHVHPDCVYIRLTDLRIQHARHPTVLPERRNHCIVCKGLPADALPCCPKFFGDYLGMEPFLPMQMNVVMHGLALVYTLAMTFLILAYAQAFYADEGNNSKVNDWVLLVGTTVLLDIFVSQPLKHSALVTGLLIPHSCLCK